MDEIKMVKIHNKTNTVVMIDSMSGYGGTIGPFQTATMTQEHYHKHMDVLGTLIARGLLQVLGESDVVPKVPVAPKKKSPDAVSFIKRPEVKEDEEPAVSGIKGGPDQVDDLDEAVRDRDITEDDDLEQVGEQVVKAGRNKSKAVPLIATKPGKKPLIVKSDKTTLALDDDDDTGSIVVPSMVPGKARVKSITDMTDEDRAKLAAETDKVLENLAKENKLLRVINNYHGWDYNKRLQFITNTEDVDILKQIMRMEKKATLVDSARKRIKKITEEAVE